MNNSESIMRDHDPNDDPFAELSAETDSKQLVSPLEYGSGAADPNASDTTQTAQDTKEAPKDKKSSRDDDDTQNEEKPSDEKSKEQ